MEKSNLAAVVAAKLPEQSRECVPCRYCTEVKSGLAGTVLQCRRYPPTSTPLFSSGPEGPRHLGDYTLFPVATALCGEFSPKVAVFNPLAATDAGAA